MARLRTPVSLVSAAINVRTEGLGVRATRRSFGKSHATIMRWERRVAHRRQQNLYAKRVEGLQRVLDVQRLIRNWVRPNWGLKHKTTPAMAMGYCQRPLSVAELLTLREFDDLTR